MALFSRLALLGGAAAGAAYFLKKRQEGSGAEQPSAFSGADSTATTTHSGGAESTPAVETIGDDAAAGVGTSDEPAGDASSQATKIGAAIPDMSASDPIVREQENAAAAEAGAIGGEPETPQSQENIGMAEDPAMQPVQEASGDEAETLEDMDRDLGIGREREV